jgi:hypothetical protein
MTAPFTPAAPSVTTPDRAAEPLRVTVASSARARGRAVQIGLTSRGEVRHLSAVLSRGTRRIGRGSLARLDGRGRLKLRLAGRPKPGIYSLALTGTNPDGRAAGRTVGLRLK